MDRFVREYVFQVLVGVGIVATTVTIWALIDKYWTWPNAIVGGALLACAVIFLMDRFGLGRSLRSKVRDWLDGSGYAIQTVSDNFAFHFRMTDNINQVVDIVQQKSGDPILIASLSHKATSDQLATFNRMSREQQQKFWRGVRLELLRYGIAFTDLKLDAEGVGVSETVVPSRDLTGTEFLRRVMFVRSGARLYWELLIELNPPTTPPTSQTASGPTTSANPVVAPTP